MAEKKENRFIEELAGLCEKNVLDEKYVIAPSRRVAFEWLDWVTRPGTPVVNARVKTFPGLAIELASPVLISEKLTFLGSVREEVLFDRIFADLKEKGEVYLTRLQQSPGLIRSIVSTVRDLRLSGLSASDLAAGSFEVGDKAKEMKTILTEFEKLKKKEKLADYADALAIAIKRLEESSGALPEDAVFIMPTDMAGELKGLERRLWESVPQERRLVLDVDAPGDGDGTDRSLLAYIGDPAAAPAPKGDGTADMFHAVGEINEVRETLRRVTEEGLPFDQVEIVHTDYGTYVPMIFELFSVMWPGGIEKLPVTFSEGIPVRYCRPGRALLGWVTWIAGDFPHSTLARMVQDGLLDIEGAGNEDGPSFGRLAANLRAAPIGNGINRYIPALDSQIEALKKRITEKTIEKEDGEEEGKDVKKKKLEDRLAALMLLRDFVAGLLYHVRPGQSKREFLDSALAFLDNYAHSGSRLDEYGLHSLRRSIEEMRDCLEDGDATGLDVLSWLSEIALDSKVGGLGPRPGCVFVSPLRQGGHSGRGRTFIMGMDDSRFPGAGMQDPLLLDGERSRLSPELGTAAARISGKVEELIRLLARLRGKVTLSYSSRSLEDDRQTFPGPVLLSAFRILSGESEGTLEKMEGWLSHPASFAPVSEKRCIDMAEWWLMKICGDDRVKDAGKLIGENFPNIGWGMAARAARDSDEFTEYDGYVPEAGADSDPACSGGPVVSASRLQTMAECPLEYFMKYVLKIEPPEEYVLDPDVWLDPMDKGGLLHEVFRVFMTDLCEKGKEPEFDRDWPELVQVLDTKIDEKMEEKPPPSDMVFKREKNELQQTARIFLQEEEEHCRGHRPRYFEAAIGMYQDGKPTPLDTDEPAVIKLPNGKTIKGRGQIDRVDEVKGSGGREFSIWDYKTGSSWKYRQDPPFWGGRCVQNAFYLALAQEQLSKTHKGARITGFGYFFPNLKEHGERVEYTSDELAEGKEVIANLCEMIGKGVFPFTNKADDLKFTDYSMAFNDIEKSVQDADRKLNNPANEELEPMRELRVIKTEEK